MGNFSSIFSTLREREKKWKFAEILLWKTGSEKGGGIRKFKKMENINKMFVAISGFEPSIIWLCQLNFCISLL